MLNQNLPFDPGNPEEALRQLPARQAVFALYGENEAAEPYIGVTPGLRRRLPRASPQCRSQRLIAATEGKPSSPNSRPKQCRSLRAPQVSRRRRIRRTRSSHNFVGLPKISWAV